MNIEDVKVGDLVVARDDCDPDGPLLSKRVTAVFRRTIRRLRVLTIRCANGRLQEIQCTDSHPFWVVALGWEEAERLREGQLLAQADGSTAVVAATSRRDCPAGVMVCNFEVEDSHTYFVSAGGQTVPLWVHNACIVRFASGESGTSAFVDAIGDEIRAAVDSAEQTLGAGGHGGTPWGQIYQNLPTGHWLRQIAYGNAVQQIADNALKMNPTLSAANVVFNEGSRLGLRSAAGNLLRPDYQLPLPHGGWATFEITTAGQAPKILKYQHPSSPYLVNLVY